jgi:hypothetical protein
MRSIEYLSPSALSVFEKDPSEYYLRYLTENRPPRFPQNQPMAIGSSFDAYVKAWLHEKLFGKGNDPKFDLQTLFEAQVESQHRTWAWEHGKYVFEQYKQTGALSDLMLELQAGTNPRFEFDVKGAVNGYREGVEKRIGNVVLMGKPDATYINSAGHLVVLDFKVNGYCSAQAPSPMPHYLKMRSAGGTNHGSHKLCQPMMVDGTMINVATYLEHLNKEWATQLSTYAWLCGQPVGSKFIVAIDQLCCDATKGDLPAIRVAEHRLRVSEIFQRQAFERYCNAWEIIHSDHFFRDMDQVDSARRCSLLDRQANALVGDGTANDRWFLNATRAQ